MSSSLILISPLIILSVIIISVYIGYYFGKRAEIKRMEKLKNKDFEFHEVSKKIINGTLFSICIKLPYFLQKKIEIGLYEAYEVGLSRGYANCLNSKEKSQ